MTATKRKNDDRRWLGWVGAEAGVKVWDYTWLRAAKDFFDVKKYFNSVDGALIAVLTAGFVQTALGAVASFVTRTSLRATKKEIAVSAGFGTLIFG